MTDHTKTLKELLSIILEDKTMSYFAGTITAGVGVILVAWSIPFFLNASSNKLEEKDYEVK